ncbi:hypothetical protein Bca52824_082037 [Brassica carinata]|uniref:Uncharacterized protein n=1 Tax=Brassica carinata TaxID=52824 RepID=A0A8X7TTT6_BRACI|nr:hypothetical protein Bca52824_082037 [Brassica carinata]
MSAALVGLSKSEGFAGILPSFFIPSLLRQAMALAAPITVRRFSMASSAVVVFVLLTATSNVRPSLTSQHYMGLIELLVVVCEAIVCRMGSGYGAADIAACSCGHVL